MYRDTWTLAETNLPIQPIQPGIFVLGPTEVDQPMLMPLWLPLWMVICIGIYRFQDLFKITM